MRKLRCRTLAAAALSAPLALAACGTSDPGNGDGGRRDGAAEAGEAGVALDATTDTGGGGNDTGTGYDALSGYDNICGANSFNVRATPPNVLILLDRSCSMRNTPAGGMTTAMSGMSKWAIAVSALQGLTTRYATQVRWGLIYLPRGGTMADGVTCTGSPVCGGTTSCPEVAPGPGTGPMVVSTLGGISPFVHCADRTQVAMTPLHAGLQASGMVTQLRDAGRNDFVLLITDGEETCITPVAAAATQLGMDVMALRSAGIRTAVIGFGAAGAGGVNQQELNAMAAAGGLPAPGANQYYAADNMASLSAALTTIVGAAISCTFSLSAPPSDLSLLHVYVDGATEVPRDTTHAMGWDYDPGSHSVTLYGSTCTDVQSLRYSQLDVLEGCPGMPPPPPPMMCHHVGNSCNTDNDCCNLEGLYCDTINHVCQPTPG